ncbi:MAG: hypothetical protein IJM14_07485 [Lachnospiraceae bacterium]|nr:hypothetical protein [Lachnospiraceae bacterium]
MMNFTNPHAKKALKGHKKTLTIGLILLLAGVGLIVFSLIQAKKGIDNPKSFSEITHRGGHSGEIVTLNVTFIFDPFASRENSKKESYSFATDGEDYYIIRVTEKELEKLQNRIEDEGEIEITGVTRKISDDKLIEHACTFLNAKGIFPGKISKNNFKGYVGAFYLDYSKPTAFSMMFSSLSFLPFMAIAFMVIGLLVILAGYSNLKKFKKLGGVDGSEIARLDAEMNAPNALWLDDLQAYATSNHVIGLRKGVSSVKYEDILWFYMIQHMTNGIKDYRMLNYLDKTGVEKTLTTVPNRKNNEESVAGQINMLQQKIWENNNAVIIGYSPEIAAQMKAKAAELKAAARRNQ